MRTIEEVRTLTYRSNPADPCTITVEHDGPTNTVTISKSTPLQKALSKIEQLNLEEDQWKALCEMLGELNG